MSEEIIIRHCAPTLAGLKTGEIFHCKYEAESVLQAWVRDLNGKLSHKGLRVLILRCKDSWALVYVYRPGKLQRDIAGEVAAELLWRHGYVYTGPEQCIQHLIERLHADTGFPHEIGLFLGYPPEDVKGFIERGAHACKCVGYWRVYGDEEKAKRIFSLYDKCAEVYMKQFKSGRTIERLTVWA